MITNFEPETIELSDTEQKIAKILAKKIKYNEGEEMAVSNPKIISFFKKAGFTISQPRIRKIVQYLRLNGIVKLLVGTNKGYFVAKDENEAASHIASLNQRIRSMQTTRDAMKKQSMEKWGNEIEQLVKKFEMTNIK